MIAYDSLELYKLTLVTGSVQIELSGTHHSFKINR